MGAARLSMALCLKLESSVSTSAMWRLFSCIWPSPVNSTATALTLGLCKAKPTGTPGTERFSRTKLLHTTNSSKVTLDPFPLFGQCQSCSHIVLTGVAVVHWKHRAQSTCMLLCHAQLLSCIRSVSRVVFEFVLHAPIPNACWLSPHEHRHEHRH